jgi:hypothetical protein
MWKTGGKLYNLILLEFHRYEKSKFCCDGGVVRFGQNVWIVNHCLSVTVTRVQKKQQQRNHQYFEPIQLQY